MPELNRWPGLFTDSDPHDSPGAQVQENCHDQSLGTLAGRKGMREVFFGNATARVSMTPYIDLDSLPALTDIPDLIACASFLRPEGEVVVFMDTAGTVRQGRKTV